jgi:hypothetical protein
LPFFSVVRLGCVPVPDPSRPVPVTVADGSPSGAAMPPGVAVAPAVPADHFAVAVPAGVAYVGVKVYQGAEARRAVAGPGETLRQVGRSVVLVFYYSSGGAHTHT